MRNDSLIQKADLLTRIISFDGLQRHRGIHPTDLDAVIDYNGNAWLIAECKHIGNKLPYGQQKALENMASQLKNCLVVVCEHTSTEGWIYLKDCSVTLMYWNGQWKEPKRPMKMHEVVEQFESRMKTRGVKI